ncbi:hypothetical protein BU17DRAFT_81697 [Hysterangium stoloniferum]|nr:hypothetical protein BU17DRAFT_81697 [Hysterangium stoloniferum]
MRSLSLASQNHILSLLDVGHSASNIAVSTGHSIGTVSELHSKHCSYLPKSIGGHPPKLSPTNIHYAQQLISSGKADTAVDVAKALRNVTNQSICTQTIVQYATKKKSTCTGIITWTVNSSFPTLYTSQTLTNQPDATEEACIEEVPENLDESENEDKSMAPNKGKGVENPPSND